MVLFRVLNITRHLVFSGDPKEDYNFDKFLFVEPIQSFADPARLEQKRLVFRQRWFLQAQRVVPYSLQVPRTPMPSLCYKNYFQACIFRKTSEYWCKLDVVRCYEASMLWYQVLKARVFNAIRPPAFQLRQRQVHKLQAIQTIWRNRFGCYGS